MNDFDTARLIYLSVLGFVVAGCYVVANRQRLSTMVQQALIWVLIFVGVMAAVGLWGDVRRGAIQGQIVAENGDWVELPRHADGHYYVTAEVNGEPVVFVVDTGASEVVLTQEDARRVGLDPDTLDYVGRAYTANGEVRTAPVRLDSVEIGPIRDQRIVAVVNEGQMDQSLLGMSYLQRFSNIQITEGKLVLSR